MNRTPDGKKIIFIWRGKDRKDDTARLSDAIVAAVPDLCQRDGGIMKLDAEDGLFPVNLAELKHLIGDHVCGARVIMRDARWQWEYFAYEFPVAPKHRGGGRPPPPVEAHEPDAEALMEIYMTELILRLPRVVE